MGAGTLDLSVFGSPRDWSLPPKFAEFREIQCRAALDISDSPRRIAGVFAPVGSGKTLLSMLLHRLLGSKRTAHLTATKGLESQLIGDFSSIGLRCIHGRNSYACSMGVDCETGAAARCSLKGTAMCPYDAALKGAMESELIVTNYHYWLASHRYGRGLGDFDLLICDEAGELIGLLDDVESLKVYKPHVHPTPPDHTQHSWWRSWAQSQLPVAIPDPLDDPKAYQRAKAWESTLKTLSSLPDDWVIDEGEKQYQFSPLWPGRRASSALFREIPKIVLMSGTIRPKTIELLGVGAGEYDFFEYESPFDPERSPVYWVPTCRVDNRISAEQETIWLRRMDQIIRTRADRKGIIHAVSYRRAKYIMGQSEFRHMMVTHSKESGNAQQAVERFKAVKEPKILVSPSVMTGYDFKDDACRYQILAKVPFPDNRDQRNLAKARQDEDQEYAAYGVVQQIAQTVGRVMRDVEDWGETFIIDDHVSWFMQKYQHLAPKGLKVQRVNVIPDGQEVKRQWSYRLL